jgi:hypothetical protein
VQCMLSHAVLPLAWLWHSSHQPCTLATAVQHINPSRKAVAGRVEPRVGTGGVFNPYLQGLAQQRRHSPPTYSKYKLCSTQPHPNLAR